MLEDLNQSQERSNASFMPVHPVQTRAPRPVRAWLEEESG